MLDHLYDGVLLTNLLLVPLSYSTSFTQTLILKETQSQNLIIILGGVWLTIGLLRGKISYAKTPYNFGLFAFVAWAALSILWTPVGRCTSIRDLCLIASYVGFFVLLTDRLREPRFRSKAILVVFFTASIIGAISVLQFFKVDKVLLVRIWGHQPLGNFAGVFLPRVTEPRISIASTIGHNISVATFFMVMGFISLAYVLTGGAQSKSVKRKSVLAGIFLAFCAFLILISQTRGVYLAFPPGLLAAWILVTSIRKRSKHGTLINPVADSAWARLTMLILVGGLVVCLAGVVIQKSGKIDIKTRLESLSPKVLRPDTRIRLWAVSLGMIHDYPLTGVGIATFKILYPDYQARYFQLHPDSRLTPTGLHTDRVHNEYLQVPVELGAVGLGLLLLLIIVHLKYIWRLVRSRAETTDAQVRAVRQVILGAGTLAILIDAFASFYFHVVSDALMLVYLGALLVALSPSASAHILNLENLSKRRYLKPVLVTGILLATVFGGHFGPGLVTWFLPDKELSSLHGPVAHALGDCMYNAATRRFTQSAQLEAQIRASEATNKPADLVRHYGALAAFDRDTSASLEKAHGLAPYRGQIPYLRSKILLHLSTIDYYLSNSMGLAGDPEGQRRTFAAAVREAEAARASLNEATKEYRYHGMYDFMSTADVQLALLRRLEFERDQLHLSPNEQEAALANVESLVHDGIAMLEKASRIYPLDRSYLEKLVQSYADGNNLEGVMSTISRLLPLEPDYVKSTLTKSVTDVLDRIRNMRFYGDRKRWSRLLDTAGSARTKSGGDAPWNRALSDLRSVPLDPDERDWPSLLDEAWKKKGDQPWTSLLQRARKARLQGDEPRAAEILRKEQRTLRKGLIPLLAAYELAIRSNDFDRILRQGRLLFECERFLGKTKEAENLALEINRLGKDRPDTMALFFDCYYPDRLDTLQKRLYEELASREDQTLDRALLLKFAILDSFYGRLGHYNEAVEMWEDLEKQRIADRLRPLLDLWRARDLWACERYPEVLDAIDSATRNSAELDPNTRDEIGQSILRDFSPLLLPILES